MPEYKLTLIRPNQKLKVIWRTAFVQRRNPASREFFLKRFEYGMQRGEKMDKREVRAHALAELKAKIEAAKRERAIKRGLIVANSEEDGSSVKRNPVVKTTKFKRLFQRVLKSTYKALEPSRVMPLYSFIGLRTQRPALITPFAMEAIRQSFTVRMDPRYSKLKIRI